MERELNGVSYSDPDDYQCTWDDAVLVEEGRVILLNFPGATAGASLRGQDPFGDANPADVNQVLSRIESVFPGTEAAFTGNAKQSSWADSPWHKGAYSYWPIGGYTSFVGAAGTQEMNIHFAGEHTSTEFQGFMEGAVETGERVGKEVFQDL